MPKYFILTGEPGVGKTTLVRKISSSIRDNGYKVSGFFTEEVRKNGIREGFDIVTLDGVRGRLARDLKLLTGKDPIPHKVGKYGVVVNEFENIALQSMSKSPEIQPYLLVIDEIGKMELFSEPFKAAIKSILQKDLVVLATIPVRKSDQLIENIRNHRQAKIWMVTRENRNNIHKDILEELSRALEFAKKN